MLVAALRLWRWQRIVGRRHPRPRRPSRGPVELTIFGAASLEGRPRGRRQRLRDRHCRARRSRCRPVRPLPSRTQIVEGAPADVFLSADPTNPQKLVDADLASADPLVFAANELAIIVPTGNPAAIASAGGSGPSRRQGHRRRRRGADHGLRDRARRQARRRSPATRTASRRPTPANVASREEDVKAVVARIELGEGDVAIVYATDAAVSTKVETIEVPDGTNVRASYAGVVLKASDHPAEAEAFLAWLAGPDGQAILLDVRLPAARS